MGNSKSSNDVRNEITAAAVGVPSSLDARVVFHAVRVNSFDVAWLNCPSAAGTPVTGALIGAGQAIPVGTVNCGVPLGSGFCRACTVRVSVNTTAGGPKTSDAVWTFNVPPCSGVPSE